LCRLPPTLGAVFTFSSAGGASHAHERTRVYAFAQRYTRARGEHGLKMIGTLQALGLGGMYQRPKMGVYVDNNGRQWQTNEVEMEEELEKDAEH
jgi:hypothetical protein